MRLSIKLIAIIIILGFYAALLNAQDEDINYKVKKGDTLWGIAGEKLDNHSLWQEIVRENPDINNPNLILPGQQIKLMTVPEGEAVPQEPMKEDVNIMLPAEGEIVSVEELHPTEVPTKEIDVLEKGLILRGGYIVKNLKTVGKIVSAPSEMTIYGWNDYVYIEADYDTKKYYIVKENKRLWNNLKYYGKLIDILGVVEIIGDEAGYKKGILLSADKEIPINSLLIPYYDLDYTADNKREVKEKADGQIIGIKEEYYMNYLFDILYTNKGIKDGVKPGDIYTVYSNKKPLKPVGKMKILSVQNNTSIAYVVGNSVEIFTGYTF
ncbi:peptidoglycan-binding LysM protein [Candidatus Magnetoovum chiemensis]|nr:peptidoglycan-binding LysM protein [Candidatus Magnetoovum chiemensis]